MPTQDILQRQIQSAQALQSIVRTMKALASGNIHHYEHAVQSLSMYNQTLKQALQIVLMHFPEAFPVRQSPVQERLGIVVFGSDQGMCGRFNEQIATYVMRHLQHSPFNPEARRLLVVGTRITGLLDAAGYTVDRHLSVPSALGKVTQQVQSIVLQLESWWSEQQVDRIWVFYNRTQRSGSSPQLRQLFPFDPNLLEQLRQQAWPSRCRPMLFQPETPLVSALFRQYFFVGLYRACVESLASENASRLASMQMAEKNITERLDKLNQSYRQQRQTIITAELLDIVSGFEVLGQSID